MPKLNILHAHDVFEERAFPYHVLHVVTDMPVLPSTPGFNAERVYEMMQTIAPHIGIRCDFGSYKLHAPDQP